MMTFSDNPDKEIAKQLLTRLLETQENLVPRMVDRPIALYGAGDLGQMAKAYFDKINIDIKFVVDKNAIVWREKEYWKDTQILSPSEVSNLHLKNFLLIVCIATIPYTQLVKNLVSKGWEDIVPFYDVAEAYRKLHPLSNGWFATSIGPAEEKLITNVIEMWSDDLSRAYHLQFLAWRLRRDEWIFEKAPINNSNRFFIPEVINLLSDHESFADIGAHHGKVTNKFIAISEGKFEKIWMIEPDSNNLDELRKFHRCNDKIYPERIHLMSHVVGENSGKKQFFEGLGYASQLCEFGNTIVNVTTIDSLDISPTFLKLHLEGGELAALKGAKETIAKYKPIIVVTSYHNQDGLFLLPKWLMSNLKNYKIYFRLHSWCGTGAVIYCLPNKS
jgi:FkbM family methyltransferase